MFYIQHDKVYNVYLKYLQSDQKDNFQHIMKDARIWELHNLNTNY